jgi:DNA-binding response OmpR family regulator
VALVLLVAGGSGIAQTARHQLESADFTVCMLSTESDVIESAERTRPAVILVDAMAREGRGLDLCIKIRATRSLSRIPVILLATNASEEERIVGLESSDDYITGLQSAPEFVARVKAVVRRFGRAFSSQAALSLRTLPGSLPALGGPIRRKDIELDPSAMKIVVCGDEVEATSLEFRLIYYLSYHSSRVFSRDQLLDAVWGRKYANPRCVDACVRRLRKKIEPNLTKPTYLKSVRGAGYRFAD